MFLILTLFLGFWYGWAQVTLVDLPQRAPIYQRPQQDSRLLFMAEEGERLALRQKGARFTRIQIKRSGQWRAGYILNEDLEKKGASYKKGSYGLGGGGMYSYLRHAGKSFETEDQVAYTTEAFVSSSFSPFVLVQFGQRNFWRLIVALRYTDYDSTAMTNVAGSAPRELKLQHTMVSGTVQKMWTPFKKPLLYYGLGVEASRANKANLVLGGNRMEVASEDLPTYVGGHLAIGGQWDVWRGVAAFAELRTLGYFNQSPMILGAEAASGLIYWP